MITISNSLTYQQKEYCKRNLQTKGIEYATVELFNEDIRRNRLFALCEDGVPMVICSVVYDKNYNYLALKRLVCFNQGKGYASMLIDYIVKKQWSKPLGSTPWTPNKTMRHLLEKFGFQLQYIFDEKWCFYKREVNGATRPLSSAFPKSLILKYNKNI